MVYYDTIIKGSENVMAQRKKPTRTKEATGGQKILFGFLIIMTLPWSLIYLVVWSGRCAYCGKRILFNKKVCKKCFTNSHAIVEQFDEKIDMFHEQIKTIEDIYEIITQYDYVLNQFIGIQDIYEALDEPVDIESMKEKTLFMLSLSLEDWMKRQQFQFENNNGYRNETLLEIKDLMTDKPFYKDILQPYYDEINEIKSLEGEAVTQI